MALPTPPPYTNPIPNNPFYSLPAYITRGAYYPLTIGSGLNVNPVTAILTSSGGGGGGVTSISAGPGINVSASTGNVSVTNAGVISVAAGSGISVSTSAGIATITNLNSGTVTSVDTGAGLTGGPFSTSGTISLDTSGVTANVYTNPTITVDQYGRITLASSNPAVSSISVTPPITISGTTTPTIGILPATTSQAGAVQLSDAVNDPASVCAASTAAVMMAYDLAAAAIPCSVIAAKGTLITGNATPAVTALAVGTNGQVLTACSACATGLYWAPPASVPMATPSVAGIVFGCTDTGAANYGLGDAIFQGALTGSNNVAIGQETLQCLTSGNNNTAVGINAQQFTTTGYSNTAIGMWAGENITTGFCNTAVGFLSMSSSLSGGVTGFSNVAIGAASLLNLTSGRWNVGVGENALSSVSTARYNVALGTSAGAQITTGCLNVAIGSGAQVSNPAGDCQLAIGPTVGSFWLSGCSDLAIQPGAGIIDCAASCGTANYVLTSQGNAIEWKPVSSGIAAPNYGSFLNTGTQIIGTVNVPQAVALDTTVAATGFALDGTGTQIIATNAGTYNLQFSIQLVVTTGGGGNVEIWLAKNGNPVPNSNTRFAVKNVNEAEFAALNFVETLGAGDNLQLIWVTDDIHIQLFSYAAGANFVGAPAIPSAIVTIVPVGA